jgi:DNA-binding NtrC family response regulator
MSKENEHYRPTVLVVDDEGMIANTLDAILKQSGFSAYPMYDGESAIEAALVNPPAILISDVILPGMNGIELAINMTKIFPECKVILSSGQTITSKLLSAAASSGHKFVFLQKPVPPEVLLRHVNQSLESRTLST